jgi:hypothetical protein
MTENPENMGGQKICYYKGVSLHALYTLAWAGINKDV